MPDLSDTVPLYVVGIIIISVVLLILQFFCSLFYSSIKNIDIDQDKVPHFQRSFQASSFAFAFCFGIFMIILLFDNDVDISLAAKIAILVVYYILYFTITILLPIFIAQDKPEKTYAISKPVFYLVKGVFFPFVFIMERMAAGLSIIFGARNPLGYNEVTEEDIISMVNEGHEKGVLMAQEANMIQNIFEFDDKDAKDIMIHRADVVAIDGDESFKTALDLFFESSYSRFPVYIGDLDNIIGIVHMRELLEFSLEKTNFPKKIRDLDGIMRPPFFIPETHSINTLFTQMQQHKSHLAVVKDEYGQTSGIISMEDIIEEIVGNIFDEHDEETQSIIERGNGLYIMFGRTQLDEVANCLSIDFDIEDIETLNGFIINEIGRIPDEHETFKIEYGGFSFEVLDVKENIIQGVRVQRVVEERQENVIE